MPKIVGFQTSMVKLNKYETDLYFLQNFQCMTMLILAFCKICEHEIVLKNFAADFQANPTDISCKNTFLFSGQFTNLTIRGNKHCHALEILKKIWTCLAFDEISHLNLNFSNN